MTTKVQNSKALNKFCLVLMELGKLALILLSKGLLARGEEKRISASLPNSIKIRTFWVKNAKIKS